MAAGYQTNAHNGAQWIHISNKIQLKTKDRINIVCGATLNSETGTKEKNLTTEDYYRWVYFFFFFRQGE